MTPQEELELLTMKAKARLRQEQEQSAGGIFDRLMTGMGDIVYGGGQFLENATESLAPEVAEAVQSADEWLHKNTGGFLGSPEGVTMDDKVSVREEQYLKRNGLEEGEFDGWRLAGNIGTTAASAARLPFTFPALIAEGFGASAAQPRTDADNYWKDTAIDSAIGAAGGAGGKYLADVGGRWADQYARPALKKMKESGVVPTVGQSLGGAWNTLEEAASSVPFIGSLFKAPRGRAVEEWQSSVLNDVVSSLDGNITATGKEGLNEAYGIINKAYDDALDLAGDVDITPSLRSSVNAAIDDALDVGLNEGALSSFNRIINKVVRGRISKDGVDAGVSSSMSGRTMDSMTPDVFKTMDSELNTAIESAGNNIDLANALTRVRDAIRGGVAEQDEAFGSALGRADEAYAKFVRVRDAENVSSTTDGFSPSNLIRSAAKNDTKNKAATGNAYMQDTALAAQDVLGNTLADSGTATRSATTALLASGATPISPLAGSVVPALWAGSTRGAQRGANAIIESLLVPAMKGSGKLRGSATGLLLNELMEDEE
jgi:hypothetical protein